MSDETEIIIFDPTSELAVLSVDDITRANHDILRRAGRKESTRKQYAQTEKLWAEWCKTAGIDQGNFEIVYVDAFFKSIQNKYSRTTLQNMLSHLRKSVQALAGSSDDTAALYMRRLDAMKQYKIDAEWGTLNNEHKRSGKRIDTAVVWEAIHAKVSGNELMTIRNKAFYAILFFAGLRRNEVRNLKWEHVDFANDVIKVVGGKKRAKNESDDVPMLGELKSILKEWRVEQTKAAGGLERVYVVSAIRRGGHISQDKPIASTAVYELMLPYDAMPHDARHTLVTNLLDKGVALHNVSAIARHKRGQTTMDYAHAMEASKLAKTVPSPY